MGVDEKNKTAWLKTGHYLFIFHRKIGYSLDQYRSMAQYFTLPPPRNLSDFVRFFWVLESDASEEKPYFHRSMADGCTELLFHYDGVFDEITDDHSELSFTAGIHFQSHKPRTFRIERKFGIFGAYLYPYALQRLFRIPADEYTGQMPDLYALTGKEGKLLEEQMMMAMDHQSRYRILSLYLEAKLVQNPEIIHPVQSAVRFVIHSPETWNVRDLASQFNLSERQFERKFKQYSGFTPKLYMRIIRFAKACNYYGRTPETLTEIAYQCGYYDQSHFIKDFKVFSGYHPSEYFRGDAEGIEWRLDTV